MFRSLLFTFLLLANPVFADLQSCQKLFDAAPAFLSDLKQTGSRSYEDEKPGLGYSRRFTNPSSKLTVFFYDHQRDKVTPELALESFKQAARDILIVAEKKGVQLGEVNAYQIQDAEQPLPLRAETVSSDGSTELLALGVVDDCIVKLRFTVRLPIDKAKDKLDTVIGHLQQGLASPI